MVSTFSGATYSP